MEHAPQEGESSVIVSLSDAAMHMYTAAIDALPFPEDKKFHKRADVVLSGLRKLRSGLTEAASRNRSTSSVIVALSDVRRRYDSLMARAAAAPGASLGQQLYAARIEAKLTAAEVANGAGLRPDLIDDLEAGEIPTEEEAAKVRELIAALGGVPGTEHLRPADEPHDEPHEPDAPEQMVNGWEQPLTQHSG
ncbi:XRE family transcriptional regulator [Mycobacterium deserti]|uniref:XRE family transcriptional regulator n=1 Tax=Mycobacterium deserti TaxID=2978347 RepID=A0ABT2MHD6_9MYCO|nr:XRE family transcriptional regulator [Mycobacterium deserti]MCT7661406.1 XRE family transcriptional regulator [Mycobacterium deserti]